MIKVLDASKTLTALVSDTTNGLGQLTVMNDSVTEELNGIYELEFDVLTTDRHYEDLKNNMLVKVNVDETGNEQIFRVYNIGEPINLVSHVKCQHISYDLNKIVVKPFSATGAVNIKNALKSNMLGTYPFTTWTDITNTSSTYTNDIPRSFRECLGGYEGSVLDVLRPEYEWNNLQVRITARRGSDHGTRIAYGKNLTDFQQEQNNENVYDAVYGYAVVDDVTYQASRIYNKTGATFPKVLNVDFSSNYESGQVPTAAELLSYATTYATNNPIEVPSVNIKIAFVPLWQTEEYKDIAPLERVFLGDTVHVFFDKLNVEADARVIKTVWMPSVARYSSIELGSARANLNTVINETVKDATESIVDSINVDTGFIEQELNELSKLIINGLGLYRSEVEIAGGGVRYILHNKPQLADSDVQYYMSAGGIMVSTDYGTTWDAGYNTSTGELYTQALSTIILRALEIYGSTITFGDTSNKYITASVYSVNDVAQGVSFDGSGTTRFQPREQFLVNNLSSGGSMYNRFQLSHASTSTTAGLYNYQFSTPRYYANYIELTSTATLDQTMVANYMLGYSFAANYIHLYHNDTNTITLIENRQFGSTSIKTANSFQLSSSSTANGVSLANRQRASTATANNISLQATSTEHSASIINSKFSNTSSTSSANSISLTASASEYTILLANFWESRVNYFQMKSNASEGLVSLYNAVPDGSSFITTNFMEMTGTSTPSLVLENKKSGTSTVANNFTMKSTSSREDIIVKNYKAGANYEANIVQMYDSGTVATIDVSNYMYSDTTSSHYLANSMYIRSNTNNNYIGMQNFSGSSSSSAYSNRVLILHQAAQNYITARNYQINGTTVANEFIMTSHGTNGNTVNFYNYDSSHTLINQIAMNSNRTMTLYCGSDMYLYSGGAIRLSANTSSTGSSSGGTQDIHLTGYTLHFYYTSNFAVHKGSARYNLQFNSDGTVTWS